MPLNELISPIRMGACAPAGAAAPSASTAPSAPSRPSVLIAMPPRGGPVSSRSRGQVKRTPGYIIRVMRPGERDALLVVDVQADFCAGGALAVPRGDEVVPLVNRLARAFAHVVLTQDWHPPGHVSFASSHSGRKPFETIELAYGAQVLWPDHCVQIGRAH